MKKLSVILLMAALALPMMAQRTATKGVALDRSSVPEMKTTPVQSNDWGVRPVANMFRDNSVLYSWDFETDESLDGWMSLDNDGDGNNWEIDNSGYYAHTGDVCMVSRSYYGGALDPDNWLISPQVRLKGTLSIWACNYSASYPDNFAIYVCVGEPTNINDFVMISDVIAPGTAWEEYTFDLEAYAGEDGCFAIRHFDSYDQFRLYIDDITIVGPAAAMPENVTVDPAATTANVTWDDENNVAWNLRYREAVEVENLVWDFEDEAQFNEWTIVDEDGDGFNWTYFNMTGVTSGRMTPHNGEGLVSSASYDKDSGTALHPNNWLISPKVKLDGKFAFWAAGQDPSYAGEVFGVFVSTDMENWTQIGEDITATGTYTEYTFDLSELRAEEGYVAIRHYNVTDMFWLNIDDISLTYGEPNEWIVVEGLTAAEYTIEGLNPETNYEVEVQAIDAEGNVSGWTPVVDFTTLAAGETPTEKTGAPTFNGYTTDGIHAYFVEIVPTEPSVIYYRVQYPDGTWTEWEVYEDILSFTGDGKYRVEAYAVADGKLPSEEIAYEFVVSPVVGIDEMMSGKTISNVRYFNMAGQEMQQADGMTIVVTTYTDGTTSAAKVVK